MGSGDLLRTKLSAILLLREGNGYDVIRCARGRDMVAWLLITVHEGLLSCCLGVIARIVGCPWIGDVAPR